VALPLQAIDRLFERLVTTYGRQFSAMYEGVDLNAVKLTWAHELAGYACSLRSIAWALDHLPERVPNVIAFRNLCRQAPPASAPRIGAPAANTETVMAELARLAPMRAAMSSTARAGNKEWALRIVAQHAAGQNVRPISLQFAQQALHGGVP
jgi:hypothetical protein